MESLAPFLMFCGEQFGKAEEAMTFYCSVFADSRIVKLVPAPDGSVRSATFELDGREVRAIDSDGPHQFGFTPAISIWIECSSREELESAAAALADGGSFLMPVDSYGFSALFCWVADRYGVTWQLNLAAD